VIFLFYCGFRPLKSVDVEKRDITIVAKQEDWIVTGLW
jgi:hypothetical protein